MKVMDEIQRIHISPLKRTVKPDEPDYIKHYKEAFIFRLNYLNQQNCYCSGCIRIREETEAELKEIFKLKIDEKF
jgi:hypothetical protein